MIAAVEETERAAHGARRDRSIRLAVVTSFLSKGGTALLQLLAIPVAMRVMGRAEFGLFGAVSAALASVHLLEIGIGPALAHGLSEAGAKGDTERQRQLASTSFFLIAGLASAAALILAAVLWTVPIPVLFGEKFVGFEASMRPALWLGLGLFMLMILLNVTERVREGLLEVSHTNTWGAAGNVLAAAAVGVGVIWLPQVWYLVLAVHGAVVLAKLGNTVSLWRSHPVVRPSLRAFSRPLVKDLVGDGLAFATCALLVGFVEYNVCSWMVGRVGGPEEVALYATLVSVTVMQLGVVMALSTPTWPAVAEALARGDLDWARSASRRLYLLGSGFAVCAVIGWVALGPWVLETWLGEEFQGTSRLVLGAFGVYFAAHTWRHLNHALMIGTGQVRSLARVQLVETVVLAVVAWFALRHGGLAWMYFSMTGVILLATGLLLPGMVRRRLKG